MTDDDVIEQAATLCSAMASAASFSDTARFLSVSYCLDAERQVERVVNVTLDLISRGDVTDYSQENRVRRWALACSALRNLEVTP